MSKLAAQRGLARAVAELLDLDGFTITSSEETIKYTDASGNYAAFGLHLAVDEEVSITIKIRGNLKKKEFSKACTDLPSDLL